MVDNKCSYFYLPLGQPQVFKHKSIPTGPWRGDAEIFIVCEKPIQCNYDYNKKQAITVSTIALLYRTKWNWEIYMVYTDIWTDLGPTITDKYHCKTRYIYSLHCSINEWSNSPFIVSWSNRGKLALQIFDLRVTNRKGYDTTCMSSHT